ncbi:MAG TPA: S8 family serine peptidase [Puia sp.]|uniref:S8 family serine peptidase n=1 Tax=Puia sp. TaxID=2045100 RepID=UPI002C4EC1DA|nr:S8 family serine peptidase [Puia sp.]HVU96402.1 S8 family serine peptidase [Puia sp.]
MKKPDIYTQFLTLALTLTTFSCGHRSSSGNNPGRPEPLQDLRAQPKPNWQNLDLQKDGVFGTSAERAYDRLLKDKAATDVIVAVIDSGIDTTQPDLKPVLWTDPRDGSHGRNYIGPESGKEDFIPMLAIENGKPDHKIIQDDYHLHVTRLQIFINQLQESRKVLNRIVKNIGKKNTSFNDLKQYRPRNDAEENVLGLLLGRMLLYPNFEKLRLKEVDHLIDLGTFHLTHGLNDTIATAADTAAVTTHPQGVDGDIAADPLGLVMDPNVAPAHGTFVAAIIAAVRNNDTGIDGVSNHTRILMLKLSNNIREMRNADLALAIRYAADHGARIINMSFGKRFSFRREAVDEAVKYAMAKDVLIVHSAGNDGMNTDSNDFFPSARYRDGGMAQAWLTVGASGYRDDSTLPATFSNYGRNSVDAYAPGMEITSIVPHAGLKTWDGTSEAAPVVTGIAALVRSYYPRLTAIQVKEIILQSVVKRKALEGICASGGVVNAYNALKLAATYK